MKLTKRTVLYTADEVLKYVHSVIEDCANIVTVNSYRKSDKERIEYKQLAQQIYELKDRWKDREHVLRTTSEENLFKRRNRILKNYHKLTFEDEAELKEIEEKIELLRVASNPKDDEAMKLIREAAEILRKTDNANKRRTKGKAGGKVPF